MSGFRHKLFCNLRELNRLSQISNAVLTPEQSVIIPYSKFAIRSKVRARTKVKAKLKNEDVIWRRKWSERQDLGEFGAVLVGDVIK